MIPTDVIQEGTMAVSRFLAPLLLLSLAGCRPDITIEQPAAGAMISGDDEVTVVAASTASSLEVDGQPVDGEDGTVQAQVPAADGLGFVTVTHPGSGAIATRSWHQGTFDAPGSAASGAIRIRVGGQALSGGDSSVTGIVEGLLIGAELVEYVEDNPMTLAVVGTLTVESAVAAGVALTLTADGETLRLDAVLTEVVALYTADALLWHSEGSATFAQITVSGPVEIDPTGATITDPQVVADDPVVDDSGNLPGDVYDVLVQLLSESIAQAIADATANAAEGVVGELMAQIAPTIGIEFTHPLTQGSQLEAAAVDGDALVLDYAVTVAAAAPEVAREGQGVLRRTMAADGDGLEGAVACAGAPLLNPLALAVWDAGNLDGIAYTREELEQRGLPELEFPYSLLTTATLKLDLPPLLVWEDGEPWLDVGGMEATMEVGDIGTAIARTAARVPVRLAKDGEAAIRLLPDPDRTVGLREIGFDQLTDLAEPEQVSEVMMTAVEVVLEDVFGSLPAATVPSFPITALDGTPGPTVQVAIDDVTPSTDAWCLPLTLTVSP